MATVEIFIPTARQRFHNLLFQIRAALANPFDVRVTVAMSQPWDDLTMALSYKELSQVRIITSAPDGKMGDPFNTPEGYGCSLATEWALQNLEWGEWWYIHGDDDCLLPWGLAHMLHAADRVDMVIGQVLCVSRKDHLDFTPYTVGRSIERCRVSGAGALFRMSALRKLPKPWWNPNSGYADWELIEKMSKTFPYKIIPSTVHVLALCEAEQLPQDFKEVVKNHSAIKERSHGTR